MRKVIRKILCVTLSTAMLLTLSACGSKEEQEVIVETTTESAENAVEESSDTAETEFTGEPVTIHLLYGMRFSPWYIRS